MTLVDEQGSRYEDCLFKEIRFKTVATTLYHHTHARARAPTPAPTGMHTWSPGPAL